MQTSRIVNVFTKLSARGFWPHICRSGQFNRYDKYGRLRMSM